MTRGYRMLKWAGAVGAAAIWAVSLSPALAQEAVMSGSRYSAPLWAWIAAIVVAVGLSVVGLAIGYWFLRKRARVESPD